MGSFGKRIQRFRWPGVPRGPACGRSENGLFSHPGGQKGVQTLAESGGNLEKPLVTKQRKHVSGAVVQRTAVPASPQVPIDGLAQRPTNIVVEKIGEFPADALAAYVVIVVHKRLEARTVRALLEGQFSSSALALER